MKSDRRQELRQRIQALQGLSAEDRAALLGLLAEKKRYGLVWEDKPEAAHELLREKIPVFVEDITRRIEASEGDAPHHVLIEGDNLHALAALQYTHAGKIDVIYIDPPYNTGNKDFRYHDAFKDEYIWIDRENPFRHSTWISFISRRLNFAKQLLRDDGVIFISIDDNEQAQLRMLCDEFFGKDCFVAHLPTIMNLKGNQDEYGFAGTHEYTMVYTKNPKKWEPGCFILADDLADEWESDDYGLFKRGASLKATGVNAPRLKRPNLYFPVFVTSDRRWYVTADDKPRRASDTAIYPKTSGLEMSWRWSKKKFQDDSHDVIMAGSFPEITFYKKQRPQIGDLPTKKPKTLFYRPEYSSGNGTAELKSFFSGDKVFGNPKPLELILDFIRIAGVSKEFVILDFFAGSGTTLHATMALNAEDGGMRQCILVTNNENGICEEVCYERNKRVIQGYQTPKGEDIPGLTANHLHYLKTELVDREPTTKNRRQLVKLAVDLIRLKENAWDRIDGLCVKKEVQAFQGKDFTLFVVLEVDRIPAVVEQVQSLPGKSKVYVLSPDADPFTVDFEEVQDRVDLVALPEAIYRSLLPVWRTLTEPVTEAEVADA